MDALLKRALQILTEVKAVAHELHSRRLEYLGIAAVMRSFCKDFGDRKSLQIDFRSDGLPDFVPADITFPTALPGLTVGNRSRYVISYRMTCWFPFSVLFSSSHSRAIVAGPID
jgi:hypothetical protein